MTVYAEPVHRCRECGELRSDLSVKFNKGYGNSTDRCPFCEKLTPGTEKTLRFTFRKGLPDPDNTPDRKPDKVIGDADVYFSTRGEAAAEVEKEEWSNET